MGCKYCGKLTDSWDGFCSQLCRSSHELRESIGDDYMFGPDTYVLGPLYRVVRFYCPSVHDDLLFLEGKILASEGEILADDLLEDQVKRAIIKNTSRTEQRNSKKTFVQKYDVLSDVPIQWLNIRPDHQRLIRETWKVSEWLTNFMIRHRR